MNKNNRKRSYCGVQSCLYYEILEQEEEENSVNQYLQRIQQKLAQDTLNKKGKTAAYSKRQLTIQPEAIPQDEEYFYGKSPFECNQTSENERVPESDKQSEKSEIQEPQLRIIEHQIVDLGNDQDSPIDLENYEPQYNITKLSKKEKDKVISTLFVNCPPKAKIAQHFTKTHKMPYLTMFYTLRRVFSNVIDKVENVLNKLGIVTGKIKLQYADLHPLLFCRDWMTEQQLTCFLALVSSTYKESPTPFMKQTLIKTYEGIKEKIQTKWRKPRKPNRSKAHEEQSPEKKLLYRNSNMFEKMINVSVDNPTKKLAYQRQVGILYTQAKENSEIVKLMSERCPSPDWTEQAVDEILVDLVKEGIKRLMRFLRLSSMKGKQTPELAANEEEIMDLITTDPKDRVKKAIVGFAINKRHKQLKATNLIDIINDQIRKRDLE